MILMKIFCVDTQLIYVFGVYEENQEMLVFGSRKDRQIE